MDFSDVRASFFAGLSTINVRRTPEKNNGILGSPSLILSILLTDILNRLTGPGGGMKRKSNFHFKLAFCGIVLVALTMACSPKFVLQGEMVQGRVLNNDTGKPIAGAAVAIRWISNPDHRDTGETTTFKASQDVSDGDGLFRIPRFRDKDFALGIYKKGYVCWYNRDSFLKNEGIKENNPGHATKTLVLENGMVIRLKPFKDSYSRERHAGFTVLVAGECTDTHDGPFNRAIRLEQDKWRENLRNKYRKLFSKMDPHRIDSSAP